MNTSRLLRQLAAAIGAFSMAAALQAAPVLSTSSNGHAVSGAHAIASVTIDFGAGYDLATLDVNISGIDSTKLSFNPQMGLPVDLAALTLVTSTTTATAHTGNYDFGFPIFTSISGPQTFTFDFTVLSGLAENASSSFLLEFNFGDAIFNLDTVGIALSITRDPSVNEAPEPATWLLLFGAGLAASLGQRRRRVARAD